MKQAGYINLINSKSSYDINFIPNIVSPLSRNSVIADSGTTGHYVTSSTPCVDKQLAIITLPIHMPTGEINSSTHTALLPNQDLPMEALIYHIIPGLNKALAYI